MSDVAAVQEHTDVWEEGPAFVEDVPIEAGLESYELLHHVADGVAGRPRYLDRTLTADALPKRGEKPYPTQ